MSEFSRATSRRGRVADRRRSSPARQRADDELVLAGHAVHAGSAGDRMSPVALLSVQRTAGNAAAASIIRGRPHRSSRRLDPLVRRLEPERSDDTDASREHQSAAPVQRATGKRLGKKLAKPFRRLGSSAKGVGRGFRRNALWGRKRTEEDTYQSRFYGSPPEKISRKQLIEAARQTRKALSGTAKGNDGKLHYEDVLDAVHWAVNRSDKRRDLSTVLGRMLAELQVYSPEHMNKVYNDIASVRDGNDATQSVKDALAKVVNKGKAELPRSKRRGAPEKEPTPMERIAAAIELLAKNKATDATDSATTSGAKAKSVTASPVKGNAKSVTASPGKAPGAAGAQTRGRHKGLQGPIDPKKLTAAIKALKAMESAEVADTRKAVDRLTPTQLDELWPWLVAKRKGKKTAT